MRGVGGSARGWLRLCGGGPGRGGRRAMAEAAALMGQRIVWVDLEMTGLDIEKDQILEMACLITDSGLNILAEGPNLIINQPDELLDGMSDWCKEHHGKSGLTKAVKESTISLRQAEYEFLSFIRQQTPPGLCPLAGNSVHADKKFLDKHMPQFMKHLHYRIIDVSTLKELCRKSVYRPQTVFSKAELPALESHGLGSSEHLPALRWCGFCMGSSFGFLSRETIVPSSHPGAGILRTTRLLPRSLLLIEPWMTSGRASKNCSSTEITSLKGKQTKRKENWWKMGKVNSLLVDPASRSFRKTSRAQGSLPAEEKKNLSAPLLSQEGDVTGSQMGQAFKACP